MEQVLPEIREGERIAGEGELGVTLLADIEQFGVVDVRSAPGGAAPPLHAHAHHAEAFLVLEGELTFRLEDGEHRVEPETWVFVPPEVVHTFAVTGNTPGGFVEYRRQLRELRAKGIEPDRAFFEQHDVFDV